MLSSNTDLDATPAAVAALAFHLLVAVTARCLPEYLRVLGARAWIIGLVGSAALALPLVAPDLRTSVRETVGPHAPLAVGALTATGVVLWLAAPFLGDVSLVVVDVEPWAWVLVGLLLVGCWRPDGPRSALAPLQRARAAGDATRSELVRRAGLLGAVGVAVGLFVGAPDFLSAFQVLLALAATAALTATVATAVYDADAVAQDVAGRERPSLRRARTALADVSPGVRSLLVGDALVQFAVGTAAFFVVIVVVHAQRLDATLLWLSIRPAAAFALLLAVETLVALVAVVPAARFADAANARAVVGSGLLAAAAFPLALVAGPTSFPAAAALFGALGWYLATLPAREALLSDWTSDRAFDAYRVGRRAVVVPAPLVGGLLYGVSAELAFGLATCVGLLGCWEYLRFVRRVRRE